MSPWLFLWVLATVALLVALDRLLLWMESEGWINYRRRKLNRGGAMYHMLQLHSIYEPGIHQIIKAKYGAEQEEDESGDPPVPGQEDEDPQDEGSR